MTTSSTQQSVGLNLPLAGLTGPTLSPCYDHGSFSKMTRPSSQKVKSRAVTMVSHSPTHQRTITRKEEPRVRESPDPRCVTCKILFLEGSSQGAPHEPPEHPIL